MTPTTAQKVGNTLAAILGGVAVAWGIGNLGADRSVTSLTSDLIYTGLCGIGVVLVATALQAFSNPTRAVRWTRNISAIAVLPTAALGLLAQIACCLD